LRGLWNGVHIVNIVQSTVSYERWMAARIPLDRHAISFKHRQMASGLFPLLRATFYRWMENWREVAKEAAVAPALLAVGIFTLRISAPGGTSRAA
jgi:hypothetical protein